MRVDDLSDERCEFSEAKPDVTPREVHLVIWQRSTAPSEPPELRAPFSAITEAINVVQSVNSSNEEQSVNCSNVVQSVNCSNAEQSVSMSCDPAQLPQETAAPNDNFFDDVFTSEDFLQTTSNSLFDPADFETNSMSSFPVDPVPPLPEQPSLACNAMLQQPSFDYSGMNAPTPAPSIPATDSCALPSFDDNDLSFLDDLLEATPNPPPASNNPVQTTNTCPRPVPVPKVTRITPLQPTRKPLQSALKNQKQTRSENALRKSSQQSERSATKSAEARKVAPDIKGTLQHLEKLKSKDEAQSKLVAHLLQHRRTLSDKQINSGRGKNMPVRCLPVKQKNMKPIAQAETKPEGSSRPMQTLNGFPGFSEQFQGYRSETAVKPVILKGGKPMTPTKSTFTSVINVGVATTMSRSPKKISFAESKNRNR